MRSAQAGAAVLTRRTLLQAATLMPVGALAMPVQPRTPPRFEVRNGAFYLDGRPHQIRSGEMHYPRVPRAYWASRCAMARALGLNAITTYAFWNQHEPEPGRFDFDGQNDLRAYLQTAAEAGLHVILRPGPYVCAEVDFGGLPPWLLRTPGLQVRSLDPRFLSATARYLQRLADEVAGLDSRHGGPMLLMQLENEYGSYGEDREYLEALHGLYAAAGFETPLYTADGGEDWLLARGTLPGVAAVVNFDGNPDEARESFAALALARPADPRMAGEVWTGWFDHWGETHHQTRVSDAVDTVDWMMAQGHSFSLYMFHGGTSFGWLPGANASAAEPYQPDTTSYDYDAVLDEAGRPTAKFIAVRAALARHLGPLAELPPAPRPAALAAIALSAQADLDGLLAVAGPPRHSPWPQPMERYGQNYGFIVYRTALRAAGTAVLDIGEARDEVTVLVDGVVVGSLSRRRRERRLTLSYRAGSRLDLLVENTGRIGFGRELPREHKGLLGPVHLGEDALRDWQVWPLPLDSLSTLAGQRTDGGVGPRLWCGTFAVATPADTYLDLRDCGRGHVWVNGHHLGRFWSIGPQQTLFLPGVWLQPGTNELQLFCVDGAPPAAGIAGLAEPVFANG